MSFLLGFLLCFLSIFLILLVLVQRGRGGGLVGALGGPGGQSAFGSKSGDMFTWITIGTAALWGLLCIASVLWAKSQQTFGGVLGAEDAAISVEDASPNTLMESETPVDLGTQGPPGLEGLSIPPDAPPAAADEADDAAETELEGGATEPADDDAQTP